MSQLPYVMMGESWELRANWVQGFYRAFGVSIWLSPTFLPVFLRWVLSFYNVYLLWLHDVSRSTLLGGGYVASGYW